LDKDIEVFVNTYKASKVDNSKRFELVNGPIIKKYYFEDNYADSRGTLGDSCMRYDNCQSFFKLYTKNEEKCSLLVYLDENGKVLGRALVWKLHSKELYNQDQTPFDCPAEYFMDRVYTSKDSDVIKFINYAKEKNWLYKWKMTADDMEGMVFRYGDKVIFGRIVVKLGRVVFRKYPFVDTLNFCDGDQYISNVGFAMDESDDDSEEGFMMNDTDGDSEPCSNCNGTGYDDDGGDDCKKCNGDGDIDCPECRGRSKEICKTCDGDGDIECTKCHGDCEIECDTCRGDGSIKCEKCKGEGHFKCKKCSGKGNLGKCTACKGEGDIQCKTCHGQPYSCSTCSGEGKITKKWGRGSRVVQCPDCNGVGKATHGTDDNRACMCPDCGERLWYMQGVTWRNTGKSSCETCDGDGEIPCPECRYSDNPGEVPCEDCDGDGSKRCDDCDYGTRECPKCDGRGNLGKCKNCDGDGTLGDCKNPKCDDGRIECPICKGSGDRPKNAKKDLCEECSGLLDKLKDEIKSGEFKFSRRD